MKKKLKLVSHDLRADQIDELADSIVSDNAGFPGGQLLCFDRSIAPFFYTKIFNLEKLAAGLRRRSGRLKNPVYLVVDNTLDFETVNAETLFPGGIPENVFLVFTPSQAKLHQLGFDFTTGGLINIQFNEKNRLAALRLRAKLEEKLSAEKSCQGDYQLRLLDDCFYRHYDTGAMTDYLNFMIGKRHRNAPGLMGQIASGLGPLVEQKTEGLFEYRHPKSGGKQLVIPDPKDPAYLHKVEFSFHYEPESNIHAYLKVLEADGDRYIAGPIFEEIKRRVFKSATALNPHFS